MYCNNGFRAKGASGLYFQDYGGGWFMSDTQWIRSYGGKDMYCSGKIMTELFQVEQSANINGNLTAGNIRKGTAVSGANGQGIGTFSSAMTGVPVVCANPLLELGNTGMYSVAITNITTKTFQFTTLIKDGRNGQNGGGYAALNINYIAIC